MWAYLGESPRFHFLDVHIELAVKTWNENSTDLWLHKEAFNTLINVNSMNANIFVSSNNQRRIGHVVGGI